MNARFLFSKDIPLNDVGWARMGWISRPSDTGSNNITQILILLDPGFGHYFHHHPRQEEIIYVLEGEIEHWLETEKRTLKTGDGAFIGMGTVHGTFNVSEQIARLLVVLSPCVTEGGYEVVDVSGDAPWNALRK